MSDEATIDRRTWQTQPAAAADGLQSHPAAGALASPRTSIISSRRGLEVGTTHCRSLFERGRIICPILAAYRCTL